MNRLLPRTIVLTEETITGVIREVKHNVMPLSEASLNRMMEHGKTGMIIISGNRSEIDSDNPENSLRKQFKSWCRKNGVDNPDKKVEAQWLKDRNAKADKHLKNDIMRAGWSFSPVYGGYKGNDGVTDNFEPSFVVYNYNRKGEQKEGFDELKNFAIRMCKKYRQNSVYVQGPGEPPVYLDGNGNQVSTKSSLDFKFNREKEDYFTTTKRDKTDPQRFTGDISFDPDDEEKDVVFENMYHALRPADYTERLRRDKQGEFIL